MSADLYRVIALTSVETDATECALSDDNAVFQLIELAQQISRVIKSDAGIAVFRPEQGDASVVGIAKADSGQALQLTKAATDVLAERTRQISHEGWTPEHDDEHTCGELVQAAADLCLYGTNFRVVDPDGHQMIGWGLTERHRDDRRRQLVIADALILAEIERFDRDAAKGGAA